MSKGKKILIILVTALFAGGFILAGVYFLKSPPTFASAASEYEQSLKIDDFKYDVKLANVNGEDKYVLSLTNNSKYKVISTGIYYKVKEDVAEDQDKLKVFDDYIKEVGEGATAAKVILFGIEEAYIPQGTTIDNIPLSLGIASQVIEEPKTPTSEQFALLDPSTLIITFVGDDNVMYNAYYDISKKDWDVQKSGAAVNVNQLVKNTNEKLMPSSLQNHLYYSTEPKSEGLYSVTVFDFTQDEFKSYVESLKSQGFTENIEAGTNDATQRETFAADDSKGNHILVTNDYKDKVMEIGLEYK